MKNRNEVFLTVVLGVIFVLCIASACTATVTFTPTATTATPALENLMPDPTRVAEDLLKKCPDIFRTDPMLDLDDDCTSDLGIFTNGDILMMAEAARQANIVYKISEATYNCDGKVCVTQGFKDFRVRMGYESDFRMKLNLLMATKVQSK